jgi:hypothetical protein
MNPTVHAARLGLARGWVEARHSLTNPQDLGWNLFVVTVFVVVLLFQRNAKVEGSALPLAMLTLPSILGTWVAVGGYTGAAGALAVEREDGTLLRAKAVPQGMVGYLVGRIVSLSLITVSTLVIIFVAGLLVLLARAGHPLGPAAGRRRPGDLGIVAAPGDRRRARRVGAGGSADRARGAAPHGTPRVGLHRGGPPATAPATHPLTP